MEPKRKRLNEDDGYPKIDSKIMFNYLTNPRAYDCTILLNYPKAIQRAYKDEKRYMVPAPTLTLKGNGWLRYKENLYPKMGQIQDDVELAAFVSLPTSDNREERHDIQVLSTDCRSSKNQDFQVSGTCKKIYTRHSKSFIHFRLMLKLVRDPRTCASTNFGKLDFGRIKVISKASKKKQIVRSGEKGDLLSIKSGSKIALYNRNQYNKKFMFVDERGNFSANFKEWSLFEIHLVDESEPFADDSSFYTKSGVICYGNIVKLVHVGTGKSFPFTRIRRVGDEHSKNLRTEEDKKLSIIPATFGENLDEPLSLLHSCAFETIQPSGGSYLASTDQSIVTESAVQIRMFNYHLINESAKWTVVTGDSEERTFAPLLPLKVTRIAPFPTVKRASMTSVDGRYVVELVGNNFKNCKFTSRITVWFGCCQTKNTVIKSNECIRFDLPTYQEYIDNYKSLDTQIPFDLTARISLVREFDAIVYPTNIVFKYSRWEAGEIGHFLAPEEQEEEQSEQDYSLTNSDTFESINHTFSFDRNYPDPQYYQFESCNFNFHFPS